MAEGYQCTFIKEVAKGADCLVVLVEHQIIKEELARKEIDIKQATCHPLILRSILNQK
ncbi:hypothetical protein ACFLWS_05700 [Chloroflexota bacterium]